MRVCEYYELTKDQLICKLIKTENKCNERTSYCFFIGIFIGGLIVTLLNIL